MIGKVITYGETRDQAIRRMRIALSEMIVSGIKTNIPLHQELMHDTRFMDGGTSIQLDDFTGGVSTTDAHDGGGAMVIQMLMPNTASSVTGTPGPFVSRAAVSGGAHGPQAWSQGPGPTLGLQIVTLPCLAAFTRWSAQR